MNRVLPVVPENIPYELRSIPHWVCWKLVDDTEAKKPRKIPVNPRDPKSPAAIDNPDTWSDFATAYECYRSHNLAGLFFALTEDLGLVAIDIDDCLTIVERENGESEFAIPHPWLAEAVKELDTYTEVSPSGRGLRIIARGRMPGQRHRKKLDSITIEFYDSKRFISLTGHPFKGPKPIREKQAAIEQIYSEVFDTPQPSVLSNGETDWDILLSDHMRKDPLLKRLWEGDETLWTGTPSLYPSQSEADLALARKLARILGPDRQLIKEAFSASALGRREKWRNRPDYQERTISKALEEDFPIHVRVRVMGEPQGDIRLYEHARDLFLENFRRIEESRAWLRWTGAHWKETDEDAVVSHIMTLLAQRCATLHLEALKTGDTEQANFWYKLQGEASRRQPMIRVVRYAGGLKELRVSRSQLDRHPWLLNLQNGTLDLMRKEFRRHNPDELLTKIANVHFDPKAEPTAWLEHLNLCLPDPDIQRHLQRSLGRALVGEVLDETMDIWYGPDGANGKSTTMEVIRRILGNYATKAAPKLLARSKSDRHPIEVADLAGCRIVFASELDREDALNESLVKDLTGGEVIKARNLYEGFFMFPKTFCIFLLVNHLPTISSTDGGIWRRLRVVRWEKQIPPHLRKPQSVVVSNLTHGYNGSGVLNWMIEGLYDYLGDRDWVPEKVVIATETYKQDSDPLHGFVEECCELGREFSVRFTDFYQAYQSWCYENGWRVADRTAVTQALRERGVTKKRQREGQERPYVLYGIRLKEACHLLRHPTPDDEHSDDEPPF